MNRHTPLTTIAQQRLAAVIKPGDAVVDATVGNGHDTLFLARQVGATGQVWGFDVQARALAATRELLQTHGLAASVRLLNTGHQDLARSLPASLDGRLAAVMFNLGYLPGSDKRITTQPVTTIAALDASLGWLRPGGVISLLVYRGHHGGQHEADAVLAWLQAHTAAGMQVETIPSPGPVLYLAGKPR